MQYISDSIGVPMDVFIPIDEWNELKNRYNEIIEDKIEDNLFLPQITQILAVIFAKI